MKTTLKIKVKVIIPFEEFDLLFAALPKDKNCQEKRCVFSRTTCHVRKMREDIRLWWQKTNGSSPGFACYERVFQNAINVENKLYWAFWTDKMQPSQIIYAEMVGQIRAGFEGKPIDTCHCWGYHDAWRK